MELTIDQQTMRTALASVGSAVAGKNAMPILANVLIRAHDGHVSVSATDLQLGVSVNVDARIVTDGDATVPYKLFNDLIGNLPNEKVHLTYNNVIHSLTVDCGRFTSQISGLNPKDYPSLPTATKPTLSVPAKAFADALAKVVVAAATDDSRPVLTGVYMHVTNHDINLFAADGFRLGHHRVDLTLEDEHELTALIPARTMAQVAKVMRDEETIDMEFTPNHNIFYSKNAIIMSRILDGKYPDVNRILVGSTNTYAIVKKSELLRAIKLASLMTVNNLIRLSFGDGITVFAAGSQVGASKTHIDAERNGSNVETALNARYLVDALNTFDSDMIRIATTANDAMTPMPIFLSAIDEFRYTHIIMPMTYK